MVVTEYGVAVLSGRSVRERAQALIDIAHPEDRPNLVDEAKEHKILYADQIFLADSAHLYPQEVATSHTFKGGLGVRFRAIRPSDERADAAPVLPVFRGGRLLPLFCGHKNHAPLPDAGTMSMWTTARSCPLWDWWDLRGRGA